jgi:Recombinase
MQPTALWAELRQNRREIVGALNREGIRQPRGARWNAHHQTEMRSGGAGIIFNEVHVGRIVWNKVRMVKPRDVIALHPAAMSRYLEQVENLRVFRRAPNFLNFPSDFFGLPELHRPSTVGSEGGC